MKYNWQKAILVTNFIWLLNCYTHFFMEFNHFFFFLSDIYQQWTDLITAISASIIFTESWSISLRPRFAFKLFFAILPHVLMHILAQKCSLAYSLTDFKRENIQFNYTHTYTYILYVCMYAQAKFFKNAPILIAFLYWKELIFKKVPIVKKKKKKKKSKRSKFFCLLTVLIFKIRKNRRSLRNVMFSLVWC